jgi:two-component system LytT family response regulator
MSIRTVIIDDEMAIVEGLLQMLIKECPQVKVVATATDAIQAKQLLRSKPIDLVFLDVKLGDGNSFHILKEFQPLDFQVIFITAYDQYAVDAFRFSALDFLLKPIDPDDLKRSIAKAEKVFYAESLQLRLQNLMYNQQRNGKDQNIVLKTFEAYHVVRIRDIIQCEAKGNYTLFHLKNTSNILISQTLKKYDQLLTEFNFFRCHQSHLVNMDVVIRFDRRDGGALVLENNQSIPVSSRRKEQLFGILRP